MKKEEIKIGESYAYSIPPTSDYDIIKITKDDSIGHIDLITGIRNSDKTKIYIPISRFIQKVSKEKTPEYWL